MINSAFVFSRTSASQWRERWLAIGSLVVACGMVSVAFQSQGPESACLIMQISACTVLLATAGLSLFLVGKPRLHVDKIGISEKGFLLHGLDWSMCWNEIAYAELKGRPRNKIALIGLNSDQVEHVLGSYDQFDVLVSRLRDGLRTYRRHVIDSGISPSPYLP
jgi:hypothetical protein